MNGTVEYTSPSRNNRMYRLINLENGKIYAIEIMSMTGDMLSDMAWIPGDITSVLFALTDEEYALKDNDTEKLDTLADELFHNLPKDRMLDTHMIDSKTGEKKKSDIKPKTETMDDFKYPKYSAKRSAETGLKAIDAADKLWVIYNRALGDNYPTIDGNGAAWVFTSADGAKSIIKKNEGIDLCSKEYSKSEFLKFIKSWFALGLLRLKLNPGTDDVYAQMTIMDILPEKDRVANCFGAPLHFSMVRFCQNHANSQNQNVAAMANASWNVICHQIQQSLFLVPFMFDGEDPYPADDDYIIHGTDYAVHLFNQTVMSVVNGIQPPAQGQVLNGIMNFYGGEKYTLVNSSAPENDGEKLMRFLTLTGNNDNKTFIPAYTDFVQLKNFYGDKKVRVALLSYREIASMSTKGVADGNENVGGIVINPVGVNIQISPEQMTAIDKALQDEADKRAETPSAETEESVEENTQDKPAEEVPNEETPGEETLKESFGTKFKNFFKRS